MWEILRPVILVLLWDLVFLILCGIPLVVLAMIKRPAFAVLKRNFVGYFMNPTGYAFLVLFVFLCSLAQFWPYAFFNANMATLDQLSAWFPLVMLTFIPAITMSIWADERRQGTDELLLTIPANDFDIVIGKYLSTAAIFTVSLLFSQVTILFLLDLLSMGNMDIGLFLATYLGYWLAGLAMLALGMVGSFLTSNVTIGFMLAALLNLPLVAAAWADSIVPTSRMAELISRLSISGQLEDFERGVVSLSSTSYFIMLTVLGLFLSMVLIGRRHWMGGRRGQILSLHFIARAVSLVVILVGVNLVFAHYDVRPDLTHDKVNKLHPDTLRLIDDLNPPFTIVIEAYISDNIPEMFAPTSRDLVTLLREIDVRGGDSIEVRLHKDIPVFSAEAIRANERFGIQPQTVTTMVRGTPQEEEIILAAAITMGPDQEVIPFFYRGIPVEYELIRTIITLAGPGKKTIDQIVEEVEPKQPVKIEAYIGQDLPPQFAETSKTLLGLLRQLAEAKGERFEVHVHENVAPGSTEAREASERFGIESRQVPTEGGGKQTTLLAVALSMGSNEQIIPFIPADAKVEEELSRAILSLTSKPKKTLGIVTTDAKLTGGVSFSTMSRVQPQRIVGELMKQYEVVQVDPSMPIEDIYDVLLVAQPSSLGNTEINNLVDAIRRGIPTAIFEDPLPFPGIWTDVPGTEDEPEEGGMMGMQFRATEKGSLRPLWSLLGVDLVRREYGNELHIPIIWQSYNPYPQIRGFDVVTDEWVFIDNDAPLATEPLNLESRVTKDLEQVLLIYPGAISQRELRSHEYTPLVRTGKASGEIWPSGLGSEATSRPYDLAVHIRGRDADAQSLEGLSTGGLAEAEAATEEPPGTAAPGSETDRPLDVILVSDIDVLNSYFLQIREQPNPQMPFRFDNVAFVLNIIDELADDDRFMGVRTHKRSFSTLRHIEDRIRDAEKERNEQIIAFRKKVEELQLKAQEAGSNAATQMLFEQINMIETELQEREDERAARSVEPTEKEVEDAEELRAAIKNFEDLQSQFNQEASALPDGGAGPSADDQARQQSLQNLATSILRAYNTILRLVRRTGLLSENDLMIAEQRAELKFNTTQRQLQAELDEEQRKSEQAIKQIENESQMEVRNIQNSYKVAAVIYPVILPIIIGVFVFLYRRHRENVGTVSERMR